MAEVETQIEWQAREYHHFAKNNNWFWLVGGVGFVLLLLAVFVKNFFGAVLAILGTFTVMLYGIRPPETIDLALMPKGVRVKNRLYPYSNLKSFWVDEDDPRGPRLIVETDSLVAPHLVLLLPEEVSPEIAREYLLQFLPEVKHKDTFADMLGDALGF